MGDPKAPTLPDARPVALRTGTTLAVRERGMGGAPVLLLIHPWVESSRCFDRLLAHLPPALHVVAPDLRGHGESEAPPNGYSLGASAADLVAVMDELNLAQAVLVGSSSGGYVAQQVAVDHPERVSGLVLVGSPRSLPGRAPFADDVDALSDPLDPEWVRSSLSWFPVFTEVPEWYLADRVADGLRVPARIWQRSLAGLSAAQPPTEAGSIATPTLVIRGQHDDLLPRSDHVRLVDAIAGARLAEYPDCGHAVLWERPDLVAADVLHFVAALPSNLAGPS